MDIKKIKALYDAFTASNGVTTDSRNVPKGAMFIALKGENFDGNTFAVKALEQGAEYAVVSSDSEVGKKIASGESLLYADKFIVVEDTLDALQSLARYHRSRFSIPVIALTGTNGKTTTKELLCAVLSRKYKVTATIGNLNNHIGVPLTLLRIDADTQVAVVEMGANHPGEIKQLCSIALPNYGLITNVGKAHLEGFGSFSGVKAAKGELYDYIQRTADIVFYNVDSEDIRSMVECRPDLKTIRYGMRYQGVRISDVTENEPFLRLSVPTDLSVDNSDSGAGNRVELATRLIGNYNADNVMAALNVGLYLGVSLEEGVAGIASYIPSNNRSQLMDTGRNILILDTYNANPSSMNASITNFSISAFSRKVLVLGDMLELGQDSANEHIRVMEIAADVDFERCIFVGGEFAKASEILDGRGELDGRFEFYADSVALKEALEAENISGYTFLIKGSNGIKLPVIKDVL